MTPNQTVAMKLREAREMKGLTQEQAAELLAPLIGAKWSKASFSAAERSVAGKRIRQFTADEIAAFSKAFDLPVSWFFGESYNEVSVTVAGEIEGLAEELARKVRVLSALG